MVKGSGWQLAGGVESLTSRLFCHKTAVASYTVANSAKLYCLLEGRKVEGSFDVLVLDILTENKFQMQRFIWVASVITQTAHKCPMISITSKKVSTNEMVSMI